MVNVHRDLPEVLPTEARYLDPLLYGGVGLGGAVCREVAPDAHPLCVDGIVCGPLPGGDDGTEGCRGGGILEDPGE